MDFTRKIDLSRLQILLANFVIVPNVNTVGYELKLVVSDLPWLSEWMEYTCHQSAYNQCRAGADLHGIIKNWYPTLMTCAC